ncbi:MAG: hypothetical protein ACYC0P_00665 [Thiobacillus sp.]
MDFTKSMMIGRQELHLSRREMSRLLKACHVPTRPGDVERIFSASGPYADEYLRFIGSEAVDSTDYSGHEGATHVHDMNQPIPDSVKNWYSVVIDGGSLEHIFNLPIALRNCMEMTAVGGHFISITPANNFLGHGFYQFSPELFFSALSEENGFEIVRVIAFENRRNARWFAAKDPRVIGRRVTLCNSTPTYLLVLARRIAERPIFAKPPQQSDYLAQWEGAGRSTGNVPGGVVGQWMKRHLYKPLERSLKKVVRLFFQAFNPRFFEPVRWPSSNPTSAPRSR